jgi:hypothetical protein
MSFRYRWKHKDGSIVEFSEKGWRTDDPGKDAWLNKMSVRNSPSPVLTVGIKIWLQRNCQLVEFRGLDEAHNLNSFPGNRGNEFDRPEASAGNASHSVSPPSKEKSEAVRQGGCAACVSTGCRLSPRYTMTKPCNSSPQGALRARSYQSL